ncbi:MAG: hypothetical protein KBB77_01565 [Candidatus Moranbacteria bacterium]|nr:hypothetical protein [Candidatus Moranbacteria bacterium]
MKYFSLLATYTWKHWLVTYALVALFSGAPLLSVVAGSLLGKTLGCGEISETSTPNCTGGSVIESLYIIGWFGIITFPFGAFVMGLLIIANILWYFTRKSGETE